MNLIEYFISCEIFKELLECVQYLHEYKDHFVSQIIHRDLKPDNILIAENAREGRFVRICDFGLAALHNYLNPNHTGGVGTVRYMAPEVRISHLKYTNKCDIYSLGMTTGNNLKHLEINGEITKMEIILDSMCEVMPYKRPDCSHAKLNFTEIENTYFSSFEELEFIGKGLYGYVCKVRNKSTNDIYAIKMIELTGLNYDKTQQLLNELGKLKQITSNYIIELNDLWLESKIIYIRMEYFAINLRDCIHQKQQESDRQPGHVMDVSEYFTSYHIFKNILECVQYLHELNPQIIHKNIKPENFLFYNKPGHKPGFKISDFYINCNMMKNSDDNSMIYTSPELLSECDNITFHTDIYSLGVIAQEIFDCKFEDDIK
ncbi:unnamed protein product [Oppiella nova]|uniref:Protein kinase domain-containing protein n=1 Tax=Oppiella nova TaxID=334625 RepID=A0A7R9M879_9ACAR|nr:unnamed protein product [Oppiella nova]CAG2172034.1 unnamed protein product [Oppiella nova]